MTRFWRQAFWRTSKNGVRHRVRKHLVDRDSWGPLERSPSLVLSKMGVLKSRSARFATPNARCPVCGEQVWYYQNEYGSRVFFDDIGWPWPKHPCTDTGTRSSLSATRPEARTAADSAEIDSAAKSAGIDLDYQFRKRHGKSPWELMVVTKSVRNQGVNLIVAQSVEDERQPPFYFSFKASNRSMMPGDYFSRRRDRVSILDSKTLKAREFAVRCFRSEREFLELIPSINTQEAAHVRVLQARGPVRSAPPQPGPVRSTPLRPGYCGHEGVPRPKAGYRWKFNTIGYEQEPIPESENAEARKEAAGGVPRPKPAYRVPRPKPGYRWKFNTVGYEEEPIE
jgi:hypothetical protein